ncbi:HAD family hydrolase [Bacteroidota bacterium]
MGIKAIIWDWNGTLLDDCDICLMAINKLLYERNLPEISKNKYKQIFTFPVKKYYEAAGFDFSKEAFDIPAIEFIDIYYRNLDKANLYNGALEVLQYFKNSGLIQWILSATESEYLLNTIEKYKLKHFFEQIQGTDDHFAHSKAHKAELIRKQLKFHSDEILYIGDTLHDLEIGEILGCKTILVSYGHQDPGRFPDGSNVIDSLQEIKQYLV